MLVNRLPLEARMPARLPPHVMVCVLFLLSWFWCHECIKEKVVNMGASESQPGSLHTVKTLIDRTKLPSRHGRFPAKQRLMFIIDGENVQQKAVDKSPLFGAGALWFLQLKNIPVWTNDTYLWDLPVPPKIHLDMRAISGMDWKPSLKEFLQNTPYHSVWSCMLWHD